MIDRAGGRRAAPYMHDGNYVVASKHERPWRKQLNLLAGYLYFYNPIWLVVALLHRKTKVGMKPAGMQLVGMLGLTQSVRRTLGWALRLRFGKIERLTGPPQSRIPMHGVAAGEIASHAPVTVTINMKAPPRAGTLPILQTA